MRSLHIEAPMDVGFRAIDMERNPEMTTISYRHPSTMGTSLPSSGGYMPFFSRIARRWQQWRSLRELESLSDDMRKDLGWPAANEGKNSQAMR